MSAFGNDAVPAVGGISADTVAQLISQFAVDPSASAGRVVAITAGNTTDGLGNVVAVAGASFTIPAGTTQYICVTAVNTLVMEAAISVGNEALWQFTASTSTITTSVDMRYNFSGVPTVAAFLTRGGMDYFTLPITTAATNAAASAAAALASENAAAASAVSAAADALSTAADAISTAADAAAAGVSEVNAAASAAAALGSKNVAVAFSATAGNYSALATTKANEAAASAASALLSKNTATTMASTATTMATSAQASTIASNAAKVLAEAAAAAAQASATSADASATLASAISMGNVTAALQAAPVKPAPDSADKLVLLDSATGYVLKATTVAALLTNTALTGTTSAEVLEVTDNTQSTSAATGCATFTGGVGIAKRLNVGENILAKYSGVNSPVSTVSATLLQHGITAAAEGYSFVSGVDNLTRGTYSIRLSLANGTSVVIPFTVTENGITMTGTTQVAALTASGLATLNGGVAAVGAFGATNTQAASSSFAFTNASASAGAYTQIVATGDAGSCIMGYSGSGNAVTGAFYDGDFAYLLGNGATSGLNIGAGAGSIRLFAGGTGSGNRIVTVSSTGVAVTGAISATTTLKSGGYTVATLPAGTAGMTAYVTDATTPTWLAALTGGGAVVCPVFHNGTAWRSA